jgi:hypothetical protein
MQKLLTFFRWRSIQENLFGLCSVCVEIVSSYAQCAIKLFRVCSACACYNFQKLFKNPKLKFNFESSTIKKYNFEKPFRNPSNRTQVNILKKKKILYLAKKTWFRVCSVTAKMFEHQNSDENRRKRSKIIFENLPRI